VTAAELSGKALATEIRRSVKERAEALAATLAIVVPTTDESTAWYVRSIAKAGEKVGVRTVIRQLDGEPGAEEIRAALRELAADDTVHGIILQTPLPQGVVAAEVAEEIPVAKDVDGASPRSAGHLATGLPAFAPATAAAVIRLLRHHQIPLAGRRVTVVGRSAVVGKPLAQLLLAENATVTIAHSRTADLPAVTRAADVVVAAAGRIGLITAEHIAPGAVVVDVGTNTAADGSLVGDVDAAAVAPVAGMLSPVPGGVGPVTTALLLDHTVTAAAGR
jgi:methylenetetrahydrofolate dehydrogenase (NADP+)/methenyltetrahydrofolate cyclohydrolase